MALALFDLDNTLLSGDSDYLWGVFLTEIGAVDADLYQRENDRFYQEYREGRLDIFEFLEFSLRPLTQHEPARLLAWREQFLRDKIDPIISPEARALVEQHRAAGDTLLIITATNAFVTAPIAARFGVPNLIATEPEQIEGRYTGRVAGVPSYRDGKVTRLQQWLSGRHERMDQAWFYSDSHNDLPLLEQVGQPVAVNPDPVLQQTARERGWRVLHLGRPGDAAAT